MILELFLISLKLFFKVAHNWLLCSRITDRNNLEEKVLFILAHRLWGFIPHLLTLLILSLWWDGTSWWQSHVYPVHVMVGRKQRQQQRKCLGHDTEPKGSSSMTCSLPLGATSTDFLLCLILLHILSPSMEQISRSLCQSHTDSVMLTEVYLASHLAISSYNQADSQD